MEIYLIRHGTTAWNAAFRLQGKTDTPLDPLGIEMARCTGERFRELGITFDRVYSSPLSRAYRTAELVAGRVDITTDPRLEELGFGIQEGRCIRDLGPDESVPFRFFKNDPVQYDRLAPTVGAESLTALCERTGDFLREVVEGRRNISGRNAGEEARKLPDRILISAHGACNKGLLMHIRGDGDLSNFWEGGLQPNCGVDLIVYDPETGIYTVTGAGRIYYPEELLQRFRNQL